MADPDIGARIARWRRRSQVTVAGLVGRSESWLSQVERGVRGAADNPTPLIPPTASDTHLYPAESSKPLKLELQVEPGLRGRSS